jgi:hypothetical protein
VLQAGMNGFLAKPVQPDEIESLLAAMFGARARGPAPEGTDFLDSSPAPLPPAPRPAGPPAPPAAAPQQPTGMTGAAVGVSRQHVPAAPMPHPRGRACNHAHQSVLRRRRRPALARPRASAGASAPATWRPTWTWR